MATTRETPGAPKPASGGGAGGYWAALDASRRRIVLVVVAGAAVLLGAAVVLWALSSGGGSDEGADVAGKVVGGPAADPPASTGDTPSADVGAGASGSPTEPPGPEAAAGREPFVAYRADGALWVSGEDGRGAIRVVEAREGAFALSPDGGVLAAVDAARGVLVLVDVLSKTTVEFGRVMDLEPSWAPDSSWVAFTIDSPKVQVIRVERDGSGRRVLADGTGPRISPDGRSVAYLEAGTARLSVAPVGGRGRIVPGVQLVGDYDWVTEGLLVYASPGPGPAMLNRVAPDGSGAARLDTYGGSRPVAFSRLRVSPDRKWLAYAETGDDGYSRMWTIAWDGSGRRYLSVRRDDYPTGWSADGQRILFIQGNAGQGDPTALMEVRKDGTARLQVVEGARP